MKYRIKRIVSVLAVLMAVSIILMVLRRQQETRTVYTKDLFAMDTLFSLKIYGPHGEAALRQCEEKVRELENQLSVTKEGSDIWKINHGEKSDIAEIYFLVKSAIEIGEETEGALDITLYPLLREWGFTTGEYRIPTDERIQELLKNVDYRAIRLEDASRQETAIISDRTGKQAILPEAAEDVDLEETTGWNIHIPAGMEIDLGAVAKGYTGELLVELLKNQGVTSALLDLGGNVQTLGTKPDGTPWQIAIRDPFEPGRELGILRVSDKAVITSGSYERYFTGEDGRRYGHILDPADGYPAHNGLASVTVVGDSGVRCDGLSTALFVMGMEKAVDFYRQQEALELVLVTEEGKLYITEGLVEIFEGSGDWNAEIIYRETR